MNPRSVRLESSSPPHAERRCRAVALVLTLLALLVLVATTARLATIAGFDAVRAARRTHTLQHELAVDSTLQLAAIALRPESPGLEAFDATGEYHFALTLDACQVRVRLANDAAKLNVAAFDEEGQARMLARKLRALGQRLPLPAVTIRLRPTQPAEPDPDTVPAYCSYDQLFGENAAGGCFRWEWVEGSPETLVWSDVLTLWGDGRVDPRHARPEVLEVLLEDLDRSAANALAAARRKPMKGSTAASPLEALAPAVRDGFQSRLGTHQHRYALTIETRIHGDRRLWYAVVSLAGGRVQTIYYKGPLRW